MKKETAVGILKILERNDFDIGITAKEVGLPKDQIEKLLKRYGNSVFGDAGIKAIANEYEHKIKQIDIKFIEEASSLRFEVLEKIRELLPKVTNMNHLVDLLKTLDDIIGNNKGTGQSNNIHFTFMQRIEQINNVIDKNNVNKFKDISYEDLGTNS